MQKPLGCLSPLGLFSAVVTLLIIALVGVVRGGVLFSPGDLNATTGTASGGVSSHFELAGRCEACHAPFWSVESMSARCRDCHTQVSAEISDPQSMHGILLEGDTTRSCRDCHTEHQGKAGQLTQVKLQDFPHERVGFALAAHARKADGTAFVCDDCHSDSLTQFDVQVCAECHQQIQAAEMQTHRQTFGGGCLACHDGVDSYGANFDHNRLVFALQGEHAEAACGQCHQGQTTIAALQATAQDCFACHQQDDAHSGQFGQECGVCHDPAGWENAVFDHSQTRFALVGKHAEVQCEACHAQQNYTGTSMDCVSCHQQDDAHDGEFGADCAACHTAEGWEGATFDHSLTQFPLTGAHTGLPCQNCHTNGVYEGVSAVCSACHQEPAFHAGLFAANCEGCHTTADWVPAQYDQPHNAFPINHEDANTCRDCHTDSLNTYTCYTCHNEAETAAEHREEGIANFTNCMECHLGGAEGEREGGDDGGDN